MGNIRRLLFVDDEQNILDGLERMLRPMRHEWHCSFINSPTDALELMERESFDILVSDMRMPVMDGIEFLEIVMRTHPNVVRIVLSGHCQQEMVMRAIGPAHQYLRKPCDADELKATIMRVCALQDMLESPELRQLVTKIKSLPVLPALYTDLVRELSKEDANLDKVSNTISQDLAMSAKILQMVNSAFFGLRHRVSSPKQAVSLLGLETVKALALSVSIFSQLGSMKFGAMSIEEVWRHSMATATMAKAIALTEPVDRKVADDAFLAGFLHDTGRLIFLSSFPIEYAGAMKNCFQHSLPVWKSEQATFGASHAELGAYLLGLWGIQRPIVEAVAYHHRPNLCPYQSFGPLTAVHVADCYERLSSGIASADLPTTLDVDYIKDIGMEHRMPIWREHCLRSLLEGAA